MKTRAITRRGFLGATGVGAAAVALSSTPAWAMADPGPVRMMMHVLSDVHISDVYPMNMHKMRVGLTDMNQVAPGPDALIINGDLVEFGHPQDYPLFDLTLATSPHPERVFFNIGNHEYHAGEDAATMLQRYLDYTGLKTVYHQTSVHGYPLIFCGSEGIVPGEDSANAWTALITDTQLSWLQSTLTAVARPDRPTFFFLHQPPYNVDQQAKLEAILSSFPNVIYFWGHWHTDLYWYQEGPDSVLLNDQGGYWSVSTGATAYLYQSSHNANGTVSTVFQADMRQRVLVEVYDNAVLLRARDYQLFKWVDGFQASIPIRP